MALREEISAIIQTAKPNDEVLLCLESPGGIVYDYGFAASQLSRLIQKGLHKPSYNRHLPRPYLQRWLILCLFVSNETTCSKWRLYDGLCSR